MESSAAYGVAVCRSSQLLVCVKRPETSAGEGREGALSNQGPTTNWTTAPAALPPVGRRSLACKMAVTDMADVRWRFRGTRSTKLRVPRYVRVHVFRVCARVSETRVSDTRRLSPTRALEAPTGCSNWQPHGRWRSPVTVRPPVRGRTSGGGEGERGEQTSAWTGPPWQHGGHAPPPPCALGAAARASSSAFLPGGWAPTPSCC